MEFKRQSIAMLAAKFQPEDIAWRTGQTTRNNTKVLLFPYITARAVMDRLDAVVGPENWTDDYSVSPMGKGIECRISIFFDKKDWVTKVDGAPQTQFEAVKGGYSDSFKRCAVKWGIGRYLYNLPAIWGQVIDKNEEGAIYVKIKGQSKYVRRPSLPSWALPKEVQENYVYSQTEEHEQQENEFQNQNQEENKTQEKKEVKTKKTKKTKTPRKKAVRGDEHWKDDKQWFLKTINDHGGVDRVRAWIKSKNWRQLDENFETWGTEKRRSFTIALQTGKDLNDNPFVVEDLEPF